jgi:hypothetical protein
LNHDVFVHARFLVPPVETRDFGMTLSNGLVVSSANCPTIQCA